VPFSRLLELRQVPIPVPFFNGSNNNTGRSIKDTTYTTTAASISVLRSISKSLTYSSRNRPGAVSAFPPSNTRKKVNMHKL
jgi:hypothetical protein